MLYTIVILAMVAAFLGLRLYSVLGRRAEHEEEIVPGGFERGEDKLKPAVSAAPPALGEQPGDATRPAAALTGFPPHVERGLREIAAADRRFDLIGFMEGARGAYGMALEAFWRGDREDLAELCDKDVYAGFVSAIEEREAAGHVLDNRLIRIEDVAIEGARLDGQMARITVRFVSDIAALTRDAAGTMVAGSLDDAVESRDVWTFARDVTSDNPAWLIDETDEG